MKTMLLTYQKNKRLVVFTMVVCMLVLAAVPAFAQSAVSSTTLQLSASDITPHLFTGANIILVSLGAVMFLIAGLSFGGRILKFVVNAITSFA